MSNPKIEADAFKDLFREGLYALSFAIMISQENTSYINSISKVFANALAATMQSEESFKCDTAEERRKKWSVFAQDLFSHVGDTPKGFIRYTISWGEDETFTKDYAIKLVVVPQQLPVFDNDPVAEIVLQFGLVGE